MKAGPEAGVEKQRLNVIDALSRSSSWMAIVEDPFGWLGISILIFLIVYILIRILSHRHKAL